MNGMERSPSITAAELAEAVGGRLNGDGSRVVREVGTLEEAGADTLSWMASADLIPRLERSRAGVVIVPDKCDIPGRTTIRVADPDVAMCAALAALAPPVDRVPSGVDSSARVAPDAVVSEACIGPNVVVGPGSVIGPGTQLHAGVYVGSHCRIGRDGVLWPNVVIREYTTLGDRVIIHPNSTIGADGFGYHTRAARHIKIPQIGRVEIGDDVEIGANSCVDRARSGVTRIGRGTKIDNLVQIAHNVQVGDDCIIVAQSGIAGSAVLGRQVVIGGQGGVIDHLRIGDRVMLAAKSAAFSDLPAGLVGRGIPAVERTEFGRQTVALKHLPQLLAEFRALVKRIETLESAADTTKRG
ncbi:MAG: UDP-3-O-(3-hydroxymyristoyl)glucosamine N-acyltransferase [Planctomycetota bacterium]